jgi:hypothetical protein
MSGNIYDTNVTLIRKQIGELKDELKGIYARSEQVNDWEDSLKRKYKALARTSLTLMKYILSNYNTPKWDEAFFNKTVELMLSRVSNIQQSEISQEDASSNVGTHLAYRYIPQMKK